MQTIEQFQSITSFSTNRLYSCKLTERDIDKYIMMHTNPVVMQTLGGLRTEEQIKVNLIWNLKQWENNGFGLWMFYLKEKNTWVGRGGIRRVEVAGHEENELNYVLMPDFWHQGLATEIAKACLEIAFEVIDLEELVCFTQSDNMASRRVMEKIGFKFERDFLHTNLPHVLYRMKNHI